MSEQEFDNLVEQRIEKIQQTLVVKGKEYRRNNNPLHNFEVAAKMGNTTREKALWGFALKHYVSLIDMMEDISKGKLPKEEVIDEKIGDLINYLILAEASMKDRLKE